jgi:predicted RNase H-like nuclease (RuvC/YqgF family)
LVSDSVRPEVTAFAELEQLVKHLGDELAAFRRRALQAEARLKSLESTGVKGVVSPERVQHLERENAGLTTRLEAARARTQQMIDRVRFLRQQHDGAPAR